MSDETPPGLPEQLPVLPLREVVLFPAMRD